MLWTIVKTMTTNSSKSTNLLFLLLTQNSHLRVQVLIKTFSNYILFVPKKNIRCLKEYKQWHIVRENIIFIAKTFRWLFSIEYNFSFLLYQKYYDYPLSPYLRFYSNILSFYNIINYRIHINGYNASDQISLRHGFW